MKRHTHPAQGTYTRRIIKLVLFNRYLHSMFALLLLAYSPYSSSQQSDIISLNANGEFVLGDLVVYGKRPTPNAVVPNVITSNVITSNVITSNTVVVSDQDLRDRDARYIVREALEDKSNTATAFKIEFAPKSSVMTASGKHKVEIIAAAMTAIDQNQSFLVHVTDADGKAKQQRLNQQRAHAIVSHMQLKQSIKNRLIVPEKVASAHIAGSASIPRDSQNVIFESFGDALSQQTHGN